MCIGLSEVWSRQQDFHTQSPKDQRRYLRGKPVPLVRNRLGQLWMVDRHHRLRALLELDPSVACFGYVIAEIEGESRESALEALQKRGWLYLFDARGNGPKPAMELPQSLLGLQDDPYRSLVWKLKKEGVIKPQPLIPYHEFRWGRWLRTRPLPPFSSARLGPALPAARCLARSEAASHLAGWKGHAN
ncbi:parB-like nuclease family protein [Synechococcus sp. MEDNS5]|nr:parB-like nuclease family protein [Synechococcus sp. MEDNS5]